MFTAVVAWAIAQLTKTIIFAIKERRLDFRRLVGTGGMPSSHTTFVTALATGVGLVEGFDTPIFALAAAFALVVMYDA
ncbi:MAG: divergent PAP2 family protein, partial [Limnochordia bacterium]